MLLQWCQFALQEILECQVDIANVMKTLTPLSKQLAFVLRRSEALYNDEYLSNLAVSIIKVAFSLVLLRISQTCSASPAQKKIDEDEPTSSKVLQLWWRLSHVQLNTNDHLGSSCKTSSACQTKSLTQILND